jgi:hypothetical protein
MRSSPLCVRTVWTLSSQDPRIASADFLFAKLKQNVPTVLQQLALYRNRTERFYFIFATYANASNNKLKFDDSTTLLYSRYDVTTEISKHYRHKQSTEIDTYEPCTKNYPHASVLPIVTLLHEHSSWPVYCVR